MVFDNFSVSYDEKIKNVIEKRGKGKKNVFSGNKTLDQHFGANLKTSFFAKFCSKFYTFGGFSAFFTKDAKNEDFDQRLG